MNTKRTLACAALLLGLLSFNAPLTAAVESDIVGYTTIEMDAGKWYQVGTPFVDLETSGAEEVSVNAVFSTGFARGDRLNVLDDTGTFVPLYWNATANGWCDSTRPNAALSTVTIAVGEAVYIQKGVAGDVVVKGKVEALPVAFGSEQGNAWNQSVLMWPVATKLNDIAWSNLERGDTLYILDDTTQNFTPYYWNPNANGWCTTTRPTATLADVDVGIGKAMYINKRSAGLGQLEPKR